MLTFKTFRMSLDKQSKQTIDIAYEYLTGKESVYQQICINTTMIQSDAIAIPNAWSDQ